MYAAIAWFARHYDFFKDFTGPIATLLAAGAAVFVTYRLGKGQLSVARQQAVTAQQQARLADIRLQHDLFDRRFAVYAAARALLIEIIQNANVSNDGRNSFVRGTADAVFLVDTDLVDYLEEIRKNSIELQRLNRVLNNSDIPVGPQREKSAKEESELMLWFFDQLGVLIQKFKPFLSLDNR
jgi:hypothetical protein